MEVSQAERRLAASTPSGPVSVDKCFGYQWDQTDGQLRVYMVVPAVTSVDPGFQCTGFDCRLTVEDGHTYRLAIDGLFAELDPEQCSVKTTSRKVTLKLAKRHPAEWPVLRSLKSELMLSDF